MFLHGLHSGNRTDLSEGWWGNVPDVDIFGRKGYVFLAFAADSRGRENPAALPSELRGECFEDSSLLSVTFAKLFETHDDPNPNEQKL